MFQSYLLLLFYSLTVATASYVALPPSVDAFYQPPKGFETTQPGTILRNRTIPAPSGINATIAATYQLLFRSTDSQSRPNAVITTIFVPPNANTTKLFSMQNAYDSAAIDCGPSYQLYQPSSIIGERSVIATALQEGYYVSVPDYEGFTSAFTNGVQSGQAVLDSLRAIAQSSNITGISSSYRKVLVGGSGGALAGEWATELQPTYAPDVNIDGNLFTALTPNVTSVLQTVDGTYASGLIPLGLLGLTKQFLNLSDWVSNNLQPLPSGKFLQADQQCGSEFELSFAFQHVPLTYFGRENATMDPIPQSVIQQVGIMGLRSTPQSPIFSYKGVLDEISPVADTDALVQKYCNAGARIQYERATNANHAQAGVAGITIGMPWVRDRLNGIPVGPGCTVMNVTAPLF